MPEMKRWCEIRANEAGQLIVQLREIVAGSPVLYADYISPVGALHPMVETAYADRGPFGVYSGSIARLRVV